jgi:Rps23 Pro-64 3,4-dihydroxylase Tpa1-like proline 4-hydroxylase
MISRYGNGDYYKPHKDNSLFTALLWLNREPKEFSGGNLTFTSHNHTIEYKNNRCIIFPSVTTHEVSEVFMDAESTNGRFCITIFSIIDFFNV